MKQKYIFLLLLITLLITGCSKTKESKSENEVNENARKVIETMMTCPNTDLYNDDLVMNIGMETENSSEDLKKTEEAVNKVKENWEKSVGDCFGEKSLESFISTGNAYHFFGIADMDEIEISVKEINLVERNEKSEIISVLLSAGDEEQTVKLKFQYDDDGLIWMVTILEETFEY